MGEMDKKIAYFSECIQLINVDGRYVPDVYHIVLHILIIIAFVVALLYWVVYLNRVLHYKAVKHHAGITLDCFYSIHRHRKGNKDGEQHTNNDDHYAGGNIALGSFAFHISTYFQYFSDNPDFFTETVTGILNTPSPLI